MEKIVIQRKKAGRTTGLPSDLLSFFFHLADPILSQHLISVFPYFPLSFRISLFPFSLLPRFSCRLHLAIFVCISRWSWTGNGRPRREKWPPLRFRYGNIFPSALHIASLFLLSLLAQLPLSWILSCHPTCIPGATSTRFIRPTSPLPRSLAATSYLSALYCCPVRFRTPSTRVIAEKCVSIRRNIVTCVLDVAQTKHFIIVPRAVRSFDYSNCVLFSYRYCSVLENYTQKKLHLKHVPLSKPLLLRDEDFSLN